MAKSGPRGFDWDREQIRRLYEDERKTVEEIGLILGRGSKLVNKWCKKLGIKMRPRGQKFGSEHKGWKGGRTFDKHGYVLLYMPDHPHSNSNGYFREHRHVMEQKIGRLLLKAEVVHHIDDNPANNHPDNLELFPTNREHLARTLKGRVPAWTEEGLARIAAGVRKPRKPKSIPGSSAPDDQASSQNSGHCPA
jgi:hypothetical protein